MVPLELATADATCFLKDIARIKTDETAWNFDWRLLESCNVLSHWNEVLSGNRANGGFGDSVGEVQAVPAFAACFASILALPLSFLGLLGSSATSRSTAKPHPLAVVATYAAI